MLSLTINPRSSRLWFRMVVPTRHRAKIGKTEITFSPGSLDPVAAKAVHAAEKAKWRKVFSDLDLERDIDDRARAPKLVADTTRALADRNTLDDVVLALSKFIRIQGRDVVGPSLSVSWNQAEAVRTGTRQTTVST